MDTAAMVNFIQILIILGWTTFCADGTVTLSVINSVDGGNKLECDTEVVLVCKIDPYSNLISWSINGTLYARCSPICLDNPPYPGNYSFTYDVANGEFNLTINQVTVGDSNTNFQCDDGSNVDSITTEVVPAYSGFVTKVVETDGYQLVFTTACVHPDVQFNWFTVKVGSTNRKIYKTNQNKSEEVTLCELDNKCGGMGTARVSSSVTVGNALSGEERFLEVDVTYKNPNENRTFRFSDRTFKFKVRGSGLHCGCIIVIIYCLRWIQLIQSYFVGASQCELYRVKKVADVSNWYILLFFLECIPVVGILILVVSVCMKWQEVKPDSWKTWVQVVVGCFPLLGTVYTAVLIWQRKDLCTAARYVILCISWLADIAIFVVMVLACHGTVDMPRYLYGILAVICLITAWVNFVCLAECLLELCSHCQQLNIDIMAVNKCTDCNEYLCNKCVSNHLERHKKLRKEISNNHQKPYLHRESNKFCCEYCQKDVGGYCLTCDHYLCETCLKSDICHINHTDHTVLKHIHETGNTSNRHSVCEKTCVPCKDKNQTSDDGKCERCEHSREHKHRPSVCYCLVYKENMCVHCFGEIRKQSYFRGNQLTARKQETSKSCALHSVSEIAETTSRRNNADVLCYVCGVYLCTRCFLLHLNLENLWKLQQFDMNFIIKSELEDKQIDHVLRLTDLPVIYIFVGCFPVFGIILGTVGVWRISRRVSELDTKVRFVRRFL